MKWLAKFIFKHKPKREPDFLIGPDGDPYMRRWYVIPRNPVFNIYLHHMRHDDDDRAPHDHPWWSLSLCLHGYIREVQLKFQIGQQLYYQTNHIREGDWKWRGVKYAHRLELPEGDAWTLFLTGPQIRSWGFHCPQGWVHWKIFTSQQNKGQIGAGCGEPTERR